MAPGFPQQITSVKVLQGTVVVAQAPIAADGSFHVAVPSGHGFSLRLVGTGHDNAVFPRKTGVIDHTFSIGPNANIDLGAVKFIGNEVPDNSCDDGENDDDSEGTCTGTGSGSGSGTIGVIVADDQMSSDDGDDDGDCECEHDAPSDDCSDDDSGDDDSSDGSHS